MTSPQTPISDASAPTPAEGPAIRDAVAAAASRYGPIAPRPFGGVIMVACLALALLLISRWVDPVLTLALERNVSPAVNGFFYWVGELGDTEFYIVAALAIYVLALVGMYRGWACLLRAGFDRLARGAVLVLGSMAVGGIITLVVKKVVARARPEVLIEDGLYGLVEPFTGGSDFNSFPSSHTLTAFAVAAAIGEIAPRWRLPALSIAALVAISRVINRAHYLSDVLAAAAIGILVAHYLAPYVLDSQRRWMIPARWRR